MLIAAMPLAQMMRNGNGMDWDNGTSWGMVIAMIVAVLLVVGVIVWAVVYATRHNQAPAQPGPWPTPGAAAGPSAQDLLDQRFARGEIDTAEYQERRAALRGK